MALIELGFVLGIENAPANAAKWWAQFDGGNEYPDRDLNMDENWEYTYRISNLDDLYIHLKDENWDIIQVYGPMSGIRNAGKYVFDPTTRILREYETGGDVIPYTPWDVPIVFEIGKPVITY